MPSNFSNFWNFVVISLTDAIDPKNSDFECKERRVVTLLWNGALFLASLQVDVDFGFPLVNDQ